MQAFAYQIDIYLDDEQLPFVRHIFYGRSRAEAEQHCALHLEQDKLLKAAIVDESFNGIDCTLVTDMREVPFDRGGNRL